MEATQAAFNFAPPARLRGTLALTPRPYQHDQINAVTDAYDRGVRRMLVQAATGTGKTLLASEIAKRGTTLFIVNRLELVRQTVRAMELTHPDRTVGIVQGQNGDWRADIVVCTVQTASSDKWCQRLGSRRWDVVIADEAHYAVADSWMRLIEAACDQHTLLLGLTATPSRGDDRELSWVFDEIVHRYSIMDAVRDGWIADIEAVRVTTDLDLSSIDVGRGDYTDQALSEQMQQSSYYVSVAAAIKEHASGRRTVCFLPRVDDAFAVREALIDIGLKAEVVVGDTPLPTRDRIYKAIERREIDVLVGVSVFAVGWDVPAVDVCCWARPTRSQEFFTQSIGRVLRLHPEKDKALLIDVVGTGEEVGLATVFDLSDEKLEDVEHLPSLADATAAAAEKRLLDEDREEEARAVREHRVAVKSRAFDLFNRDVVTWTPLDDEGGHVVPLGDDHLAVVCDEDGWSVVKIGPAPRAKQDDNGKWRKPKDIIQSRVEVVAEALDLDMANTVAAQIVDGAKDGLNKPDARWRDLPATDGQQKILRGDYEPGMSRGEASDAITRKFARRDLDKARKAGVI